MILCVIFIWISVAVIFDITQISNIHSEISIKANDPLSPEPTIEVLLPSLPKFIDATVQSAVKGTTSQYLHWITLMTAFCNSKNFEIECKSLLWMIKLKYFISLFSVGRHVQYGLQPIVVVLTCWVWFTASCCGAHMLTLKLYCQSQYAKT